ncbi:hypothetical protein ACFL2K_00415 [Candidatus Margulisiibacteriota bacterium]
MTSILTLNNKGPKSLSNNKYPKNIEKNITIYLKLKKTIQEIGISNQAKFTKKLLQNKFLEPLPSSQPKNTFYADLLSNPVKLILSPQNLFHTRIYDDAFDDIFALIEFPDIQSEKATLKDFLGILDKMRFLEKETYYKKQKEFSLFKFLVKYLTNKIHLKQKTTIKRDFFTIKDCIIYLKTIKNPDKIKLHPIFGNPLNNYNYEIKNKKENPEKVLNKLLNILEKNKTISKFNRKPIVSCIAKELGPILNKIKIPIKNQIIKDALIEWQNIISKIQRLAPNYIKNMPIDQFCQFHPNELHLFNIKQIESITDKQFINLTLEQYRSFAKNIVTFKPDQPITKKSNQNYTLKYDLFHYNNNNNKNLHYHEKQFGTYCTTHGANHFLGKHIFGDKLKISNIFSHNESKKLFSGRLSLKLSITNRAFLPLLLKIIKVDRLFIKASTYVNPGERTHVMEHCLAAFINPKKPGYVKIVNSTDNRQFDFPIILFHPSYEISIPIPNNTNLKDINDKLRCLTLRNFGCYSTNYKIDKNNTIKKVVQIINHKKISFDSLLKIYNNNSNIDYSTKDLNSLLNLLSERYERKDKDFTSKNINKMLRIIFELQSKKASFNENKLLSLNFIIKNKNSNFKNLVLKNIKKLDSGDYDGTRIKYVIKNNKIIITFIDKNPKKNIMILKRFDQVDYMSFFKEEFINTEFNYLKDAQISNEEKNKLRALIIENAFNLAKKKKVKFKLNKTHYNFFSPIIDKLKSNYPAIKITNRKKKKDFYELSFRK